jgi:cytochrome c nitrite reductase small subunit
MKLPLIVAALALVVVASVGLSVTNFTAYLANDPATCNNCHVMDAQYENWYHGDHKNWATCNDCHTPHALIPKYLVKAESGYHHVTAFISGQIPAAIRARPASLEVVQANCIRCHAETVAEIGDGQMDAGRYCFDCHRSVAHGERGLSTAPYQTLERSK